MCIMIMATKDSKKSKKIGMHLENLLTDDAQHAFEDWINKRYTGKLIDVR